MTEPKEANAIPGNEKPSEAKEEIELGDIVALITHPHLTIDKYLKNAGDVEEQAKISSYHRFTSPLMVVVEVQKGKKYDQITGEKKTSYKCIYYSTEQGKFEEQWFREFEVKLAIAKPESIYDQHKDHDQVSIKKKLVGKQVILTTVDQELGKIKLYKDSDPSKTNHRESYFLDFLPPVGVITNISTIDNSLQFDENTGKKDFEKCRVKAKVKWYNNKSDRFSEEEVPIVALKRVPEVQDFSGFDRETVYYIDQDIQLEGNEKLKITKIPVRIHDLVFKHYYYQFRVKNLFNQRLIITKQDVVPKKLEYNTEEFDFETRIPFHDIEFEQRNNEFSENPDKWYKISYRDLSDRYTSRIIKLRHLHPLPIQLQGKDDSIVIVEANCLLRDGEIRNFRLDRIVGYEKLDWFENIFNENDKVQ